MVDGQLFELFVNAKCSVCFAEHPSDVDNDYNDVDCDIETESLVWYSFRNT